MVWLIPKGVGQSIAWLFRPPDRFSPHSLEAAFQKQYGERFAPHRRLAVGLAAAVWTLFMGWDVFHGLHNNAFSNTLPVILTLRTIGVAGLGALCVSGLSTPFSDNKFVTRVLVLALCLAYALILAMTLIVPFPLNYLFYYNGLLLVFLFGFGLLRLQARPVYIITGLFIVAATIFLPFAQTDVLEVRSGHVVLIALSSLKDYYFVAATVYLVCFAAIGCAVAVELEKTARDTLCRELELVDSAQQLHDRNASLHDLNEALERATVENESRTQALLAAKEDLRLAAERQNSEKSRFLAEAAHDLRQPMQAVASFLEAASQALNDKDVPRASELLQMTGRAAQLTRVSFNAVLDISRLESGFVQADYAAIEINDLVHQVVGSMERFAAHHRVALKVRTSRAGPVNVLTDPTLLGRALTNLVSNGIKYADAGKPGGATVLVGVVANTRRVRVDVYDNGIGIPQQRWPEIFKPFIQLNNPNRDRDKGLGLGLSIVNAIVSLLEEHRLDMRSLVDRGTRFSLEVPRAPTAAAHLEPKIEIDELAHADLAGAYVLCVEDDVLVRESTAALLGAHNVIVELAADLNELRDLLRRIERRPDLVITDYRLPDSRTAQDVLDVVQAEWGDGIPAIVLTGETQDLTDVQGMRHARVLLKPASPSALIREVRMHCAQQPDRSEA